MCAVRPWVPPRAGEAGNDVRWPLAPAFGTPFFSGAISDWPQPLAMGTFFWCGQAGKQSRLSSKQHSSHKCASIFNTYKFKRARWAYLRVCLGTVKNCDAAESQSCLEKNYHDQISPRPDINYASHESLARRETVYAKYWTIPLYK